jgi:hypothetical protein
MNAIAIVIRASGSDRDARAQRGDTYADAKLFRAGRHGAVNSDHRDRGHRKTLDDRMLLDVMNYGKAMQPAGNGSGKAYRVISAIRRLLGTQAFIVNQTPSSTMMKTIAPQTTGVTFLVLPLRGESFGA